jgi:MFS family permease
MYDYKQVIAKYAISWFFFVQGLGEGIWASSMPSIKDAYNIDDGILGNVLFVAAAGAVLGVPIVTYLSSNYGSCVTTLIGSLIMCSVFPVVGLVIQPKVTLIIGAFLWGMGALFLDSSVNTQAVLLEQLINAPTLGYFHALCAIGCVTGGIVGGVMFDAGVSLFYGYCIASGVMVLPNLILTFFLFTRLEEIDINENCINFDCKLKPGILRAYNRSLMELGDLIQNHATPGHTPRSTATRKRLPSLMPVSTVDEDENFQQLTRNLVSPVSSPAPSERKTPLINPLPPPATIFTETSSLVQTDLSEKGSCSNSRKSELLPDPLKDYYSLMVTCFLLFLGYFGEESVGDWSALYLSEWKTSAIIYTMGYVGFEIAIAIGRLNCDRLVTVLGRKKMLLFAGIISGCGFFVASLTSVFLPNNTLSLVITIGAFIICGFGVSVVSPTTISIIGSGIDGFSSSTSIAIASSTGYAGVLISPLILGNVGEMLGSLCWSFFLVACCESSIVFISQCLVPTKYYVAEEERLPSKITEETEDTYQCDSVSDTACSEFV